MKHQHQTFILGMIKHGDKIQAYRAAYPKCTSDETARKSAERLLLHHPAIAAEIAESTAYIRQQAYTEAYQQHVAQQKTPLLSMMKRREILAQIATCEMKVTRFVKNGDRYIMLFEDPRPRDIMQAMQLDAKFEDACNRMRNITDPNLSQFNIYIDGRPCDQPHLPPDPNLPPGIYMLPRRRKNQIEKPGIISEHLSRQGVENEETPLLGGVGVGSLAQEKIQIEEPGIISEQKQETPLPACPDHFGRGSGVGLLTSGKIQTKEPGIKTEQNTFTHSFPACPDNFGVLRELRSNHDNNTEDINNVVTSSTNAVSDGRVDKGSTQAEPRPDPLAASFYKQDRQTLESAPPPHILTPEEVKARDDEYAKQHKDTPPQPSTFGKMYFKEKGVDYGNIG